MKKTSEMLQLKRVISALRPDETRCVRVVTLGHRGGHDLADSIATTLAVRDAIDLPALGVGEGLRGELIWLRTGRTSARAEVVRALQGIPGARWLAKLATRFRAVASGREHFGPERERPLLDLVHHAELVQLDIEVSVRGLFFPARLRTYLARRAKYLLLVLWWGVRSDTDALQQRVLRSSVGGVHVGDLVASTALTTQYRLTRGVRSAMNLSACFTQAAAIVDAAGEVAARHYVHFAISPEPTYLHMVLPRALERFGVAPLLETMTDAYLLGSADLEPSERPGVHVRHQKRVRSDGEVACSENCPHLSYVRRRMERLRSRDGDEAATHLADAVTGADAVAVLFLHDFCDGQFSPGFDEFGDLLSWVLCTVDALLEETHATILVKSHSIVYDLYRRLNEVAIAEMRRRYADEARVRFVTVPVSPLLLDHQMADIDWFGITRYGTVSEELPLMGRVGISSRLGPWGEAHDFSWRYSSRSELRDLLRAAPDLGLRPDWRSELCLYLQRRYRGRMTLDFAGRGTHELTRLIDRATQGSPVAVRGRSAWARAGAYLNNAPPSDSLMLTAIEDLAASKTPRLREALIDHDFDKVLRAP